MIASNFPAKYRTRANAIENAGYYIGKDFVKLEDLKSQIELITTKKDCPF